MQLHFGHDGLGRDHVGHGAGGVGPGLGGGHAHGVVGALGFQEIDEVGGAFVEGEGNGVAAFGGLVKDEVFIALPALEGLTVLGPRAGGVGDGLRLDFSEGGFELGDGGASGVDVALVAVPKGQREGEAEAKGVVCRRTRGLWLMFVLNGDGWVRGCAGPFAV